MRTHLDLCSGIGGFALAAQWAGYTTIGFCEIDPFCQQVLAKNFPGVPIHADLKTLDGQTVRGWADQAKVDALAYAKGDGGIPLVCDSAKAGQQIQTRSHAAGCVPHGDRAVCLLTAGYPCQPFSQAGKRLGEEDDRHLWPAIAALVADLQPDQCLFENVAGHITLGLDRVLADLEALGYACGAVVVPACAVNAPHRRDRVWVMAHSDVAGRQGHGGTKPIPAQLTAAFSGSDAMAHAAGIECGRPRWQAGLAARGGEVLAFGEGKRLEIGRRTTHQGVPRSERGDRSGNGTETLSELGVRHDGLPPRLARPSFGPDWEHGIPRTTDHEPDRVNKLKALGNSIVPAVAYEIIEAMKVA